MNRYNEPEARPLRTSIELRVLSGPQAGASAELLAGMAYSIGASDTCDLVLEGPGVMHHHAQVEVSEDGEAVTVTLRKRETPDPDSGLGEPTPLAPGTRLSIGLNVIEFATAAAPWAKPSGLLPTDAQLATPVAAGRGRRGNTSRRGWWLFPTMTLAAAGSAAVMLVLSPASAPDTAPAGTAPESDAPEIPAPQHEPDLAAVARVGPGGRLRLEQSGGSWVLRGTVPDSTSLDQLRSVAVQEGIAEVRVLRESERRKLAEDFLRDEQAEGTVRTWLNSAPGPALVIEGIARDDSAVALFVQRASHALEEAEPIEFHVLPRKGLAAELDRRLQQSGILTHLEAESAGDVLRVKLALGEPDRTRWEAVLAGFVRDYGDGVELQAQVRYRAEPWTADVEAIVGGNHPYVVTRQGARIRPGEKLGNRLLTDIRGHELIFADGSRWKAQQ